jgi:hypothetical protein
MVEVMEDYLATGGEFPERAHVNVLIARFLVDFAAMVERWADWSTTVVDRWPELDRRRAVDDDGIRASIQDTIDAGRRLRGA